MRRKVVMAEKIVPQATQDYMQYRCPGDGGFFLLQAKHLFAHFGIQSVKKLAIIFACNYHAF